MIESKLIKYLHNGLFAIIEESDARGPIKRYIINSNELIIEEPEEE